MTQHLQNRDRNSSSKLERFDYFGNYSKSKIRLKCNPNVEPYFRISRRIILKSERFKESFKVKNERFVIKRFKNGPILLNMIIDSK